MRIKNAAGDIFEGPDGPVPSGYTLVPEKGKPAESIFSSPKGFMGPGILANLDSRLYGRSPEQSEAKINQTLRTAGPLAASLAMPPLGLMASIPTQGALQAGFTGATKGAPGEIGTAGVLGAGLQGLIGGLGKIGELAINKKAASGLIAREAARAKNAPKEFGDQSAARIMDAWKQRVPWWKDLTSDTKGITDAVIGKGHDLASAGFDTAMKDIVRAGAGKQIPLARDVAERIGLDVPAAINIPDHIRMALQAAGKEVPAPAGQVMVDAGKAAEAVLGKWKKFPAEYRATVQALDDAGLGSQEARSAYSAAMGLRDVVDKTGALSKRGMFDVDKLLNGLQKVKNSDILRKRGLGNSVEGDIVNATQGAPQPGPLSPKELGIEYMSEGSKAGAGSVLGHGLGYAVGGAMGHPYIGMGLGGGAGAALGRYLPTAVTKTPVTGGISDFLRTLSLGAGAMAPQAMTPAGAEAGPLNPMTLTPGSNDRAAQAALDAEWEARFGRREQE